MNCKPGDLAVILNSWLTPQERGLIVSVVRASSPGEMIVMKGGGVSTSEIRSGPASGWLCDAHHPGFPCFVADEHLRPIRDNDGTDETLIWAGKPEGVPA